MIEQKLRGVNLGGWLVLEKWMTSSLFAGTEAVDEYTLMQTPGAEAKLDHHRRTFICEADFRWLHDNGINAVRIPVGYWIFDGDAPYIGGITYLDKAIKWAKKYKLQVLIDLHGAKGSQNGHDHSGRIGPSQWYKRADYREETIGVLERLATRYYNESAVWGIELLNEPKIGLFQWKLRRFYRQAYRRLVTVARPGTRIVFHDGFTPRLMKGALRPRPDYPAVMDVHWYQFLDWLARWRPLDNYFNKVTRRRSLVARPGTKQPIIIGEWSLVLSGKTLNGRDKTAKNAVFKKHGQLQLAAYQSAVGWFYWSYKTERRGIWHFRSLVEDGVISFEQ